MLKAMRRETVREILDTTLKPLGYEWQFDTDFLVYMCYRYTEEYMDLFFLHYLYSGKHEIVATRRKRALLEVENIMAELYDKNTYPGVLWKFGKHVTIPTIKDITFPPLGKRAKLSNEKTVRSYAEEYLEYLLKDGEKFIVEHSELPYLLQCTDEHERLIQCATVTQERVIHGGIDGEFRILIISKLCDDPRFEERFERMQQLFYKGNCGEWKESFEKLKDILPYIKPKYQYMPDNYEEKNIDK